MSKALFEHVRDLAMTLKPEEQVALIGDLAAKLQGKFEPPKRGPHPSLLGSLKYLGPAPSAEDFEEARRDMAGRSPREEMQTSPPGEVEP